MEDYDMFTVKTVPRLEDLAFEKSCLSLLGDLVLCDTLLYKTTLCYHRHSSIVSMLGLNVSDHVLNFVRSRIEDLPGVVGEKFRERFLARIVEERPVGIRLSVLYDLVLFDALTKLKVRVPSISVEETTDFSEILLSKAPNLKSLEIELPRYGMSEERDKSISVLFHALTSFEHLESLIIDSDMPLTNPDHYRILSKCTKVKQLRFERIILNSECFANLVINNAKKVFQLRKSGVKKIQKNLHCVKLKPGDLTPLGRTVQDLYFEYNLPDGVQAKLMAHVLFNLPNLQTIYMDPTHVPEIFRIMNSSLKRMHPIGLKKIRVERCSVATLYHIRSVAPSIEAMELMDMARGKKSDEALGLPLVGNVKRGQGPVFDRLHTLSLYGIEKVVMRSIVPSICPNLEVLSCAFIPDDLGDLQQLPKLKKFEIEAYSACPEGQEIPVNFFQRLEAFKFSSGCGGVALGQEIVKRPGSLKELDVHCIHDINSDKEFQQFCRHGNWELLKIRRCDSLTLPRVFDILRFNTRLKELMLPKSVLPQNPMTEIDAKAAEAITRICSERQIELTIDGYQSYRCYNDPRSSGSCIDMQQFFSDLVIDTGGYVDSEDGEEDDPNFFDMLQRAMMGDYDIDDIYNDYYDSDFSYEM